MNGHSIGSVLTPAAGMSSVRGSAASATPRQQQRQRHSAQQQQQRAAAAARSSSSVSSSATGGWPRHRGVFAARNLVHSEAVSDRCGLPGVRGTARNSNRPLARADTSECRSRRPRATQRGSSVTASSEPLARSQEHYFATSAHLFSTARSSAVVERLRGAYR